MPPRLPVPKRPAAPKRPPQPSRAELLAAVSRGSGDPVSGLPVRSGVNPAWTPRIPASVVNEEKGFLGPIGDIINWIDKPRAAVMSTVKMGVDLLQGEGDWKDYLSLSLAFPTGGASLMLNKDWRERVDDNYMFSELLAEEGMDPNSWVTKGLGFLGDVAADPLMYIPGAGAAARTAQGGRWLKAAKAADDMAIGFAMTGDIAKANMMKEGAARMARNRSIISGGKEVLDELGYKAGASLLVPGTGRVGRQIVEKPLNLLTGGKLTKALAKQRAKQVPNYMFNSPTWKVAENQEEVVKAMHLLRRGSKATKQQLDAIPNQVKQAARFANAMQVEIPGAIRGLAAPFGVLAAGPGRLWGATMRRTGLQNLKIGGTARPLRAMSRSLNDDTVIAGIRALDARDVAKINQRNYMREAARASKQIKASVTEINARRIQDGLPEIGAEELIYMSDTPRSAVDEDLHELHDALTTFWSNKLEQYNSTIGHRGQVPPLKDELYAARFLDMDTAIGRKIKNIEVEDLEDSWEFRGMSGDDPTRKRKWVVGEEYFGVRLQDPEVVGKSVREQMLDIGREALGADYEDMFLKDFWQVVVRYDKATADRFFHQNWFNEMEKAGLIQAGRSRKDGGFTLSRDEAQKFDAYLKELNQQRLLNDNAYQKTEEAVGRAVKAVHNAQNRVDVKDAALMKINDQLNLVNKLLVRIDEIIEEVPEFKNLTAAGRQRLRAFIEQFQEPFEKPILQAQLEGDEIAVATASLQPLVEEVQLLRQAQNRLKEVLEIPEEVQRIGGLTPEGEQFVDFLEERIVSAERLVRNVAADLVTAAHETAEVKALQQIVDLMNPDAVAQGLALRALPPGFVPAVDLLSNQPVKAFVDNWAVETQGFIQEANVIAYNQSTGEALIRAPGNAEVLGLEPDAIYVVSAQGDKFGHFKAPQNNPELRGDWLPEGEVVYNFDPVEARKSWRTLKAQVAVAAEEAEYEYLGYIENIVGSNKLAPPVKGKWVYEPGRGKVFTHDTKGQDWDWWFSGELPGTPLGKAIAKQWFGDSDALGIDDLTDLLDASNINQPVGDWIIETTTTLAGLKAIANNKGHLLGDSYGAADEALQRIAVKMGIEADEGFAAIAGVARGGIDNADAETLVAVDRTIRATAISEQELAEIGRTEELLTNFANPRTYEDDLPQGQRRMEALAEAGALPDGQKSDFATWRRLVLAQDPVVEIPNLTGDDAALGFIDGGNIKIPAVPLVDMLEHEMLLFMEVTDNPALRQVIADYWNDVEATSLTADNIRTDDVYAFVYDLRNKQRYIDLKGRAPGAEGLPEQDMVFTGYLPPPEGSAGWKTQSIFPDVWFDKANLTEEALDQPLSKAGAITIDDISFPNLSEQEEAFLKALWRTHDEDGTILRRELNRLSGYPEDKGVLNWNIRDNYVGGKQREYDPKRRLGSTGERVTDDYHKAAAQGLFRLEQYIKQVLLPQFSESIELAERMLQPEFMATMDVPIAVVEPGPFNVWDMKQTLAQQRVSFSDDYSMRAQMGESLLSRLMALQSAEPHVVQEYFATMDNAARDVHSLRRRLAMEEAATEPLISTGQKELPSGRKIGDPPAQYAGDVFPENSYFASAEIVDVETGKVIPAEDGWRGHYGYAPFYDVSSAVPPKPLAEMTEKEAGEYYLKIQRGISDALNWVIEAGSRKKRILDPRWNDLGQIRTAGDPRLIEFKYDDGWDNAKEIHAQLTAKFGNSEIADDIVAALLGRPYEGWEGTIQRQRPNIDTHVSSLHVDGGPFHYSDSGKTFYVHPVKLLDLMVERGYVNAMEAAEYQHPHQILDFLFGDIQARKPMYVGQSSSFNEVSLAQLMNESVEGGSTTASNVQSYRDFPQVVKFYLDDLEAIMGEREGLREARKYRLRAERTIWGALSTKSPQDLEFAGRLARIEDEIANESWMELPALELDPSAVARITGESQTREFWRKAGYEFIDEPRVSGKGFPWGPPGPGSWRGPGKGPWPEAIDEPIMMQLGKDVVPADVRKKIQQDLVGESGGIFDHPQGRSFAENMMVLEALDQVIDANIIMRESAQATEIEARIERLRNFRSKMQPVVAALGRQIRKGELADELDFSVAELTQDGVKIPRKDKAAGKGVTTVEPTDPNVLPIGFTDRPLAEIKQEALMNVQARIIERFDVAVKNLEDLLLRKAQADEVLELAQADNWTRAAEAMQFDNAAAVIEENLRHELRLLAESDNVLDQVSAAASQEEAIRAVMKNRVMMSAFADAYGNALTNFTNSYRQLSKDLVPGGSGGGGGGVPQYFMGGMDEEGWRMFEEAIRSSAGLYDPKRMNKALDVYLKVANWWKAQAVASPGFIMRNLMGGAMVNSLVAGVEMGTHSRVAAMAQEAYKKVKDSGAGDVVLGARLLANEGKSTRLKNMFGINRTVTAEDWEVFADLLESGIVGNGQAWSEVTSAVLEGRMPLERTRRYGFREGLMADPNGGKGGWNPFSADFRPFVAVRTQNERAEFVLRGALGFDIMKKGGTREDAMNAINKYHFDYQDLTKFERGIKAFVPFYTWQKNIIPVLIESLGKKPQAWTGFLRAKRAIELGSEDERVKPDYYAEMMGIRLPWRSGGRFGGRIYAVPDTPFRQLFQLTKEPTSPVRTVTGGIYPWLKTPAEIWAKKQFFADIPFSGRYQQIPSSYKAIPGLMPALGMFGKAVKNNKGEWKMRDHDIYLVEQMSPIFGRHRRLFGDEEAKRRRATMTWISFLFGGGFRVNDLQERRNQLIKDQVRHSQDLRDVEDIERRRV